MAFASSIPIRSIDDVRKLEEQPLQDTLGIGSTYELFVRSAERFGKKPALRFLKTADPEGETIVWSYRQLLEGIHQTANMLHGRCCDLQT